MNKILILTLIVLALVSLLAELLPLGLISGLAGIFCMGISGFLCYKFAQLNKTLIFIVFAFVNTSAVYLLAKPYEHRGSGINDCGNEFNEIHSHTIWENSHIH